MAVGPGVTDVKVGDRVAFVGPLGGYAGERLVPADRAVKLHDNITYEQAAGFVWLRSLRPPAQGVELQERVLDDADRRACGANRDEDEHKTVQALSSFHLSSLL